MADDIVTRLREWPEYDGPYGTADAADKEFLNEAAAEIERLRAAGDALAIAYRNFGGPLAAYDAALRAWDEVRHG